jgi:hypothetical protein
MNRSKLAAIASFMAGVCFLITFFTSSFSDGQASILYVILGLVWLFIGMVHWTNYKR